MNHDLQNKKQNQTPPPSSPKTPRVEDPKAAKQPEGAYFQGTDRTQSAEEEGGDPTEEDEN